MEAPKDKPKNTRGAKVGVGMPYWLKLNQFGQLLRDAFPGTTPFLVGSAARGKEWRDVDVRIMVTAEEYERFCGEGHRAKGAEDEGPSYFAQSQEVAYTNGRPCGRRRTAITLAFAELGRQMTGLPIDFQFDLYDPDEAMSQTDGPRHPLGGCVELNVIR